MQREVFGSTFTARGNAVLLMHLVLVTGSMLNLMSLIGVILVMGL